MERWPQYRSHMVLDGQGKPRIHLNVLTYFLFWTAFYVLRGSHSSATSTATRPARTLSLTPNFGSVKKVCACSQAQGGVSEGKGVWPLLAHSRKGSPNVVILKPQEKRASFKMLAVERTGVYCASGSGIISSPLHECAAYTTCLCPALAQSVETYLLCSRLAAQQLHTSCVASCRS